MFFFVVKCDTAHVMINTLDRVHNKYSVKKFSDAHKSRSIRDTIAIPSTKDYNNYMVKFLLTKASMLRAEEILGPELESLNLKQTERHHQGLSENLSHHVLDPSVGVLTGPPELTITDAFAQHV